MANSKDVFIDPEINRIEWVNSASCNYNYMTVNGNSDFFSQRKIEPACDFPLFKNQIQEEQKKERVFNEIAIQASKNLWAILQEISIWNDPSPLLIAFPEYATMKWDKSGISYFPLPKGFQGPQSGPKLHYPLPVSFSDSKNYINA